MKLRRKRRPSSTAPVVHGDMDAPKSGAIDRDDVLVGGWAWSDTTRLRRVEIVVNDVVLDRIPIVHPRPDIAATFPKSADKPVGWTAMVDMSRCPPGSIELVARAVDDRGRHTELARARCSVEAARKSGRDRGGVLLAPQRLESGHRRLYGRAWTSSGVARVDVRVDDGPATAARVGLPSGVDSDSPDDVVGGFEAVLDLQATEPTTCTLTARVTELDGSSFELPACDVLVEPVAEDRIDPWRGATLQARTAQQARRLPDVNLRGAERHRVLVFTHDLGLGGAQLYLHELIRRLHGDDVSMTVVSPTDGVLRSELEEWGIPVHVTGAWPVADSLAYEGRTAELAAWASAFSFTSIMANTMLAFPGVDLARRMRLPAFWAIHESFAIDQFWMEAFPPGYIRPHVRECAMEALEWAEAVIFEADSTRRLYDPHLRPDAGCVVPYGVNVEDIDRYRAENSRSSVRARLGIETDERVVLCMGTIEPRKAQIALAQAFAGVDVGDAVLVLVGARDDAFAAALREYVDDRLDGRCRVIGITPDTYQWYLSADLFVCASDIESLPRSILEAMLFDVPVLATSVFGIPELIEHGHTGLLCDPRDTGAMRRALSEALGLDRDVLREIGRAGGELVRRVHAPHHYARAFRQLLDGVVSP